MSSSTAISKLVTKKASDQFLTKLNQADYQLCSAPKRNLEAFGFAEFKNLNGVQKARYEALCDREDTSIFGMTERNKNMQIKAMEDDLLSVFNLAIFYTPYYNNQPEFALSLFAKFLFQAALSYQGPDKNLHLSTEEIECRANIAKKFILDFIKDEKKSYDEGQKNYAKSLLTLLRGVVDGNRNDNPEKLLSLAADECASMQSVLKKALGENKFSLPGNKYCRVTVDLLMMVLNDIFPDRYKTRVEEAYGALIKYNRAFRAQVRCALGLSNVVRNATTLKQVTANAGEEDYKSENIFKFSFGIGHYSVVVRNTAALKQAAVNSSKGDYKPTNNSAPSSSIAYYSVTNTNPNGKAIPSTTAAPTSNFRPTLTNSDL